MTEEQKQKYLESPNHCPNCGSDRIWSTGIDRDGRMASAVVTCEECDSSWYDIYTLTDMTEFVKTFKK
jgi:transcription elongation factor Elf1